MYLSVNSVNRGDNLTLMQAIPETSIDLIYGDILYGTGKDFGEYRDIRAVHTIVDAFYRPRIERMRTILKPNGSIVLQMDNRIDHWIRLLLDDIFGYDRFVNQVIWAYTAAGKHRDRFGQKHDILYWYANGDQWTFNGDAVKVPYEVTSPKATSAFTKRDEEGRLYKENKGSKSDKLYRYYLDDGKVPNDVWADIYKFSGRALYESATSEYTGYPTQKPIALIERIILALTKPNDLVLDPFCGSGTTLVTAKRHQRKYIGIDTSAEAVRIASNRLQAE